MVFGTNEYSMHPSLFAVESWALYAVGVSLVLARLISRLSTLGSIRKLQLDDWAMILAVIPFTGMVYSANQTFDSTTSTKDTARRLKMRFLLEELQITTVWLIKGCLLILYRRIFPATRTNAKRRPLLYISIYCLTSYALTQALLPLWCPPTSNYWNPSTQNKQCLTYYHHSILVLAADTTTIVPTFFFPIALIPTPRKALQASLFLLGTCVLGASILARYYALVQSRSSMYIHWYTAEVTLMILFANLPFLSSLFSKGGRDRMRSVALSSWPREYVGAKIGERSGWQVRKGSAATEESADSAGLRKEMWEHGLLVEAGQGEGVIAVPQVIVCRFSIRDSAKVVEVGCGGRRPSGVGLLPPL
ncbi:hypothetical protein PMIN03_002909 [Paraphaeosphaeria minitans]